MCTNFRFDLSSKVWLTKMEQLVVCAVPPYQHHYFYIIFNIPHICHFFSTYPIFGSIFLHAKARKSRQNGFRKNSVICHKTDFTTTKQGKFLISSHLSCGDMWNSSKFGKNSHFSASIVWKKLKFLCMWRNLKFLHICHVLKSEIFSTWLIFLHLYIGDWGDKYVVWLCVLFGFCCCMFLSPSKFPLL